MLRAFLAALALIAPACSSSSDGGGGGGGASGGSAGTGAAGSGGVSDAGCVNATTCGACLDAQCASEIAACEAVPACSAARSDLQTCFASCSPSCWPNLETSGGKTAGALRDCAKANCPGCSA